MLGYMPREALEIPLRSIRRGRIYSFESGGGPIIVFWAKNQIVVASEVCPHLGGPLSQARLEDDGCALRCPWHGYKFDARTGAFLENPNVTFIHKRLETVYRTYRPGPVNFKLNLLPYEIEDGILRV
jgi:nitrite reductase/ring-hydroxylating ferredoxin subunit